MHGARLSIPLLGALVPLLVACGPPFDPPSKVDSLRVLAVRPEPASGAPGETVTLEILVADGAPREPGGARRPLEVAWLGGCHNPESRLYFGCFPGLSALSKKLSDPVADTPPDALAPGSFGLGPRFSLPLPDDILTGAPRAQADVTHFGISYVFFAACAGELRPRPSRRDRVPLACVDPDTGSELGSDDFVQGFSTLFTFEGVRNENPSLRGVRFGSLDVVDEECTQDGDCDALGEAPGNFACASSRRCAPIVRRCPSEGECRRILVFPDVDRASAEEVSGENAREIVWANYYTTDGEFDTDAQLVNDRSSGWIEEHGAYFRPPRYAATVDVFVTVHDQRGGAAWSAFQVLVR